MRSASKYTYKKITLKLTSPSRFLGIKYYASAGWKVEGDLLVPVEFCPCTV
jgi:hypothetical protein